MSKIIGEESQEEESDEAASAEVLRQELVTQLIYTEDNVMVQEDVEQAVTSAQEQPVLERRDEMVKNADNHQHKPNAFFSRGIVHNLLYMSTYICVYIVSV